MSWSVDPVAGLTAGSFIRASNEYFLNDDVINCPSRGGIRNRALSSRTLDVDDTYAADNIASIASYELVQIMTDGAQAGGGCGGGLFDCSTPPSGESVAYYDDVTVQWDPFGADTELRAEADGTLRPILYTGTNVTPDSNGYLMRPTALEWNGQNPANDANRTFWLPSEVIGILGTVHIHQHMVDAATYDCYLGSGIRPWNVISGTPRERTEEPVICFV